MEMRVWYKKHKAKDLIAYTKMIDFHFISFLRAPQSILHSLTLEEKCVTTSKDVFDGWVRVSLKSQYYVL